MLFVAAISNRILDPVVCVLTRFEERRVDRGAVCSPGRALAWRPRGSRCFLLANPSVPCSARSSRSSARSRTTAGPIVGSGDTSPSFREPPGLASLVQFRLGPDAGPVAEVGTEKEERQGAGYRSSETRDADAAADRSPYGGARRAADDLCASLLPPVRRIPIGRFWPLAARSSTIEVVTWLPAPLRGPIESPGSSKGGARSTRISFGRRSNGPPGGERAERASVSDRHPNGPRPAPGSVRP